MIETELQQAIAQLYAAPLESFVERRAELARRLRSANERDHANDVKALRKPSRLAWALNAGVHADAAAFARLDAAAAATVTAQANGGDVRAAIAALRGAVREFALVAAVAAEDGGHALDAGVLANTVLAVLGRPENMAQLRAGRLAETPEGGGLDFLAQLPPPAAAVVPNATAPARTRAGGGTNAGVSAAARAQAQQTAKALAAAERRAGVAHRALQAAETELAAAEQRMQQAKDQLAFAKKRRDDARQEADAAAADLGSAERANADAQRQVQGQS